MFQDKNPISQMVPLLAQKTICEKLGRKEKKICFHSKTRGHSVVSKPFSCQKGLLASLLAVDQAEFLIIRSV